MSREAVELFRKKIDQDDQLQDILRESFRTMDDQLNLVDLALEYGFEFTEEEGLAVLRESMVDGELSDFELELVAGGAPTDCNQETKQVFT